MDRWINKVAVVTGASAGIGAAVSVDLANAGMIVIGLARRKERVEQLISKVSKAAKGKLVPFKCDVTKEDDVKNAFAWIESNYGGVDVLINNAGIAIGKTPLTDQNNTEIIRSIIDTNVMGIIFCTREAFQSMKKRNVDGHVVLINSYVGHVIPSFPVALGIYPASKFAVTALTETYRQEFNLLKTKVKITSISPGVVDTEIFNDEDREQMKSANMPMMESKDISDAVLYVLGTPPHVQVHEIIIKPVGEPF